MAPAPGTSTILERVTAWPRALGRYRGPLLAALAGLLGVVLVALAVPVRLPEAGGPGGGPGSLDDDIPGVAEGEDLSAFLSNRRWGVSLAELAAAAAAANEDIEMTAELAAIGFVGLMVEGGEHAVLLVLPDGKIARLAGGDTLPDGRTLVSVTDNSLTLEGGEQQQEVLRLFPRVRTE